MGKFLTIKSTFILFILLFNGICSGQDSSHLQGVIKGTVVDRETGEPLPVANVYLADTYLGCASDPNGDYIIFKVRPGIYQIIASYVGYELDMKRINVSPGDTSRVDFKLKSAPMTLDEVVITADAPVEWKENLKWFKREFFGKSDNAKHCEILDPEILSFTGNRERGTLRATAANLIHVENRALGFELYLALEEFTYHRGSIRYKVYPRFIDLIPDNDRETKRWIKRREDTYKGSLKHFFASLYRRKSDLEGYKLEYSMALPPYEYHSYDISPDSILFKRENPFELELYFEDVLKVTYLKGEIDEREPHQRALSKTLRSSLAEIGLRKPVTWITIKEFPVIFDAYGYIYDPFKLWLYGDWVLSRIADMLPRSYGPPYSMFSG